jgi:predicted amidophosphoribosyltransferase
VVDDVMTTGATLNELAGALKRAGAARVVNLVVARTLPYADAQGSRRSF